MSHDMNHDTPLRTPGAPVLRIAPARGVREPIGFAAVTGADDDPAARAVRDGVADVRLEVFVGEQDVPFVEEIDARDDEPTTVHVLARGADGTPLGTGRILLEPEHTGQVHLGRLAVRLAARGTGLGARLVDVLEREALARAAVPLEPEAAARAGVEPGAPGLTVVLSAQEQAMGFYERCGYRGVTGESYLDAGIPHQDMSRTLVAGSAGAGADATDVGRTEERP